MLDKYASNNQMKTYHMFPIVQQDRFSMSIMSPSRMFTTTRDRMSTSSLVCSCIPSDIGDDTMLFDMDSISDDNKSSFNRIIGDARLIILDECDLFNDRSDKHAI
jgi:hypothetical protein